MVTRQLNKLLLLAALGLPVLAAAVMPAFAAPILGQNQESEILGQSQQDVVTPTPAARPGAPAVVSARATVIEFTILPSRADPDVLETTIILQQGGDSQVCVNHASQNIIVRSYETQDDPFTPDVPSEILGLDSGHVGELAGFNSQKVFIKPRSPDDRFNRPDERFTVGGFEGVFRLDEVQCDEELNEGETVCVDAVIRSGGCAFAQHASLERQLRIMLALNSVFNIAPAAGPTDGQDTGQVFGINPPTAPGGGLPSGGFGAAPNFSGSFSGSGGGGLATVPNVIGLPLANAMSVIVADGFAVGAIAASQASSTGLFDGWLVSTALAQSFPANVTGDSTVVDQSPPGGTQAAPGTSVSLVAQANAVPVPEPSTLSIFILGLLIALAMYGYSRSRSRRALRRA